MVRVARTQSEGAVQGLSSSAGVVRSDRAALRAVCRVVAAAQASGHVEVNAAELRGLIEANGSDFEALAADRVPMRLRPGGRLEALT